MYYILDIYKGKTGLVVARTITEIYIQSEQLLPNEYFHSCLHHRFTYLLLF